ncbi:hypothetical protein TREMEDRAFT_35226, partial [Tremella mesenterica DSM 1558]|uniref:uncharacterized protein n=1 Tax=Tremella mesenterica (strain ATCC 24925 / CBS 8224 / DSM 1558 / NBRC 9311 / NRRL Y-6157 / RJB 2259-6 / UBC 559-6) TaxID=578456 RepID=UPI00032C12A5
MFLLNLLLPLLLLFYTPVQARQITVKNSCGTTLWPALFTGGSVIPSQTTGWELSPGNSTQFQVDDGWTSGRVWARTGCVQGPQGLTCLTGGCGIWHGLIVNSSATGAPPATLAEFTLSPSGVDNYDISLVDGFNVPLNIYPSVTSCPAPQCQININALCPSILRSGLDSNGLNLGCMSACDVGLGGELYGNRACCSGGYNDPTLCAICGVDYYHVFKDNCPMAYGLTKSEKTGTALWTCPSSSTLSDYTVEFCP